MADENLTEQQHQTILGLTDEDGDLLFSGLPNLMRPKLERDSDGTVRSTPSSKPNDSV